jgi:hypothetical protein
MKIALLIDSASVARWQADALERLGPAHSFEVYNCTNARPPRRRLRHFPYYALSLLSLRTVLNRRVALPIEGEIIDFECDAEGVWQRLPGELVDRLAAEKPDAVIKFGMGLLKVPDSSRLPVPILSYHHGDPRLFRGRPAGFYEMLAGQPVVGQIVQILSNRLDAGQVVAFGETRVFRHSYRATMREAYATSPLLLPQALAAVRDGRTLAIEPDGKVYRLPSLWTLARFLAQLAAAKLRRLVYGALIEKEWQVAEAPATGEFVLDRQFPAVATWRTVERPRGYRFLADPFPHPGGDGILVEALSSSSGLGEILHLSNGRYRSLLSNSRHFSYPGWLTTDGVHWIVPEVSEWSEPRLYRLDADGAHDVGKLNLATPCRLIDPTLFDRNGTIFMFGNIHSEGDNVLRVWTAASIQDRFEEHPANPVLISPRGARMGGSLIESDGALYRIGQDGLAGYGDGVLVFRIEEFSRTAYREHLIGSLRFGDCRGPHTINLKNDRVLFDYYRDRFALLAGLRRIRGRLARR